VAYAYWFASLCLLEYLTYCSFFFPALKWAITEVILSHYFKNPASLQNILGVRILPNVHKVYKWGMTITWEIVGKYNYEPLIDGWGNCFGICVLLEKARGITRTPSKAQSGNTKRWPKKIGPSQTTGFFFAKNWLVL
jgi:hypothetical protein